MAKEGVGNGRHGHTQAPTDIFAAGALPTLEPVLDASNRMFETWMAISTQMLEFGKARIDQSIEAGKAIAAAKSVNEAVELQTKFTRLMMKECLDEATKIADLGTKSMLENLTAKHKPGAGSHG